MTRAEFYQLLRDDAGLAGWTVYPEIPEQLAAGGCVIVAPRSPYWELGTYTQRTTSLVVHVLVPRAAGPAMDTIDDGLEAVWSACLGVADLDLGQVQVGLLEELGKVTYIVASLDVDLT